MMQAVATVLKKNHISYTVPHTDDSAKSDVFETEVMGRIEVERLDSCETRVKLEQPTSKSPPLHQRFFDELDRVLAGLSPVPPRTPMTPQPEDDTTRANVVFQPPKNMVIETRSGGSANVRREPRKAKNVITSLPSGTEISALEKMGDWYHIVFGSGQKAWAHKIVLKEGGEGWKAPVKTFESISPKYTPESVEDKKEKPSWEPITTSSSKSDPSSEKSQPLKTDETESRVPPEQPGKLEKISDLPEQQTVKRENPDTNRSKTASGSGDPNVTAPVQDKDNTASVQNKERGATSSNIPEPPKPLLRIWKKGEVQVFDEPNVLVPPKGALPPGARVTRYEDAGSFYRIEYRGMSGYVYKDFCEIVE
jgi:hypothetical protein